MKKGGWRNGIILVAALVAAFWWASRRQTPEATSGAPFAPTIVSECAAVLKKAAEAGVLRRQPSAIRMDVEDIAWAGLPADAKRGTLQALACTAYGKPLTATDYVVAYGYRSGKRLAMLSAGGLTFE